MRVLGERAEISVRWSGLMSQRSPYPTYIGPPCARCGAVLRYWAGKKCVKCADKLAREKERRAGK